MDLSSCADLRRAVSRRGFLQIGPAGLLTAGLLHTLAQRPTAARASLPESLPLQAQRPTATRYLFLLYAAALSLILYLDHICIAESAGAIGRRCTVAPSRSTTSVTQCAGWAGCSLTPTRVGGPGWEHAQVEFEDVVRARRMVRAASRRSVRMASASVCTGKESTAASWRAITTLR